MTRHNLYKYHPKEVRDTLNLAVEIAAQMHDTERELIFLLREIDQKRFYNRYGYRSLLSFCKRALGLSRVQAQRIVTEVRRLPEGPDESFSFKSNSIFTCEAEDAH